MTPFDPLKLPNQFARWMATVSVEEREKHVAIWTKQAMAAFFLMKAVELFRKAADNIDKDSGYQDRIDELAGEVISLARDLHDYDPTSD